ncbi:hypothetical protein RMCBS344292_12279 [Rhizopus microsporus]|nr:hypothetical protein RMCBS344292_12279 [Rhizopus microsporus]
MRLNPASTYTIPVHPATEGFDVQKLAVEKHEFPAPAPATQKIAFLFSHSNGFHKESLHPLIRRLKDNLRAMKEYEHTDIHIFAWDARGHGDSARLNDGITVPTYRWFDNALDTKQVIDKMKLKKYDQLIGVGHSFGATSMILVEFFFPHTFDGLCVVEPVMSHLFYPMEVKLRSPILSSGKRRDEWQNREECKASLLKRKFWKVFDPEVLDLYVDYGMYDTDKGTIKLKCPKEHEYHVFRQSSYDTFTAYNSLKIITIPIHFVYALDSDFVAPEDTHTVADQNPAKITVQHIEGTHMVVNEKPDLIIPQIMALIDRVNQESKNSEGQAKL